MGFRVRVGPVLERGVGERRALPTPPHSNFARGKATRLRSASRVASPKTQSKWGPMYQYRVMFFWKGEDADTVCVGDGTRVFQCVEEVCWGMLFLE